MEVSSGVGHPCRGDVDECVALCRDRARLWSAAARRCPVDHQQAVVLSGLTHLAPHRVLAVRKAWLLAGGGCTRDSLDDLFRAVTRAAGPSRMAAAWRLADHALARAAAAGVATIAWGEERYPPALAQIADPPFALWIRGDVAALHGAGAALVGARDASVYAAEVARRLGSGLAEAGVTVVSGLARGVDAAAHRGALEAGGLTVAVFGSGVDVIYPYDHRSLAAAIAERGALVSELPMGTPPRRDHFPRRNRIVSGLSRAVVVIEASIASGALITARCGLEQGRDVMAVPGNVLSERNRGAHALIKDGAKVVEGPDDILDELGFAPAACRGEAGWGAGIDDPVWQAMADGEVYDVDALSALVGDGGPSLLARLLDLELKGLVRRCAGGRFIRSGPMVVTLKNRHHA